MPSRSSGQLMQRAAASASQFIAGDRQHSDASFVVFLVGPDVALVAHHHAGAQREDVVGVVPLLTLGFKGVAASGNQAHLIDAERFLNGVNQRAFFGTFQAAPAVWCQGPALHVLAHHFRIDGEGIDIDVGHDGVEVHAGAVFGELNGNHPFGLAMVKQRLGKELDPLRRRAFRHADQHRTAPDDQHIAAF